MTATTAVRLLLLGLVAGAPGAVGGEECEGLRLGTPPEDREEAPTLQEYTAALKTLDIAALQADVEALLTDSKDCWPADFGNYGPLFVRLAWHCSGSYRRSDGRGGCGGGRQRFEPERSWPDNTNLDKARALLAPLKWKYGRALSWGDLFITAGSVALRQMGAQVSKICFGRADASDGSASLLLGPSNEQTRELPCAINGQCKEPLGSTTVGLIYLNPEGPVMEKNGKPNPDPALSARDVRDAFNRMDHDDRATVALIGGGHAVGKAHGACPAGAGPAPNVVYNSTPPGTPWPGLCGSGKGEEAYTAGFEGPWTTKPLRWDNEYFQDLLSWRWERHIGPGGHWQWRIVNPPPEKAGLMRLTSDVALLHDPAFLEVVREFASDMGAFKKAFDDAWFKLTVEKGNRLWSPAARCDSGPFPEELLIVPAMLSGDAELVYLLE